MNFLTPEFKKIIKLHEGVNYTPHVNWLGCYIIGVSHVITHNEKGLYFEGKYITEDEVTYLFEMDLWRARTGALQLIEENILTRPDSKAEYRLPWRAILIIIEMVFELGKNGVRKFKRMWTALNEDNFLEAAKEMRDSKWYDQTMYRAEPLARLLESLTI